MAYTVTYKHSSGDTVICHGMAYAGQDGYYTGPLGASDRTETEWSVMDKKPIGAADSEPIDLGNGVHTFDLQVERRFASVEAARIFCRGFAGTLPRGGVSLETADTDAGKAVTHATAVLQKLVLDRNGTSVDIYFLFKTSVPVMTDIPEPEPDPEEE